MSDCESQRYALHFDEGRWVRHIALCRAIADADQCLEEGIVFEVRMLPYPQKDGCEADFGRSRMDREQMAASWGMGWIALPEMQVQELFITDVDGGVWHAPSGCYVACRLRATGKSWTMDR